MANDLLTSYASFEKETQLLLTASKRKMVVEKSSEKMEREVRTRFCLLKFRFMRSSTKHKKEFLLKLIRNIESFETLMKVVYYIRCNMIRKSYLHDHACSACIVSEKNLVDHDRSIDKKTLEEANNDDVEWFTTIDPTIQEVIVPEILALTPGICRVLYLDVMKIYQEKLREQGLTTADGYSAFPEFEKPIDDTDKYPVNTVSSVQVEKLRKKWNETIEKYKNEVESAYNKLHPTTKTVKVVKKDVKNKKSSKNEKKVKKSSKKLSTKKGDSKQNDLDHIQLLPVWIVKHIFNYLDQKTLSNLKKVNSYWKYASESVLKDRKAKKSIEDAINKMKEGIDPNMFKDVEVSSIDSKVKSYLSPSKRHLEKLMMRGATKKNILSKCKSEPASLLTEDNILEADESCFPFRSLSLFPRCIQDDLVLYRNYICPLKDINILIDFDEDTREKQRKTLTYALSEKISTTFSMSEADLAGW